MSKILVFLASVGVFFLTSCGGYKYYHPTTNAALFSNSGEIQVSGSLGTSGATAQAAYAFPGNIGLIGMYNGGLGTYDVQEGEVGVGYYTDADPRGIFICGGLGLGQNAMFYDSTNTTKRWKGNFLRPFVQFNTGITGGSIFGGLKGDMITTLKTSYFMYDGIWLDGTDDAIKSNYVLFEPAIVLGLGGHLFRFNITYSIPFRIGDLDPLSKRSNAPTAPYNVSIGLRFIINREKS